MELVVYDSEEATAAGAARRIADMIGEGNGRFTLGLAGGGTAFEAYDALRPMAVDWRKVEAWLSDERWVPHDHKRSNGRMAALKLMDHVEAAAYHRPRWSENLEAADSAAHYEAQLRAMHADSKPDLILLGMGEDAHTASLFPGSAALDERERWFVANAIPETGEMRLTSTYPLLWSAQRLMVVTAGEHKAPALRDSFENGETPAGRIGEGDAEVEWHVDRAAASLLS